MPNTLQASMAVATQKAAADLTAALLRLPEDKRTWSPEGTARTALNQVAECAVLNGYTAELLQTRQWPGSGYAAYQSERDEAAAGSWDALQARLQANTARVVAAIQAVPDDALDETVQMPWGAMCLAEIVAYPHWNMTYHLGQINYLASMLGCLA